MNVEHRHLKNGVQDSVAAVADILDRGTVKDWRELAARIRRNPDGAAARSLRTVLERVPHMYGTTYIWRGFLRRFEARLKRDARPTGHARPGPKRSRARRPAP